MKHCAGQNVRYDPHVTNLLGESFDIFSLGEVELIRFPRGSDLPELTVTANIAKLGQGCHDSFVKQVKLSGSWLQGEVVFKDDEDTGEVVFSSRATTSTAVQFMRMSDSNKTLDLRVKYETPKKVHFQLDDKNLTVVVSTAGRMHQGVGTYLNLHLDGFGNLNGEVGGMLGIDDHSKEKTLGKLMCERAKKHRALHAADLPINAEEHKSRMTIH
jgi:hypothetical protein